MPDGREGPLVVTIDGPAGSGKSTTAKEVARRLGFRHLDSGALYRAMTVAVMRADIPEGEWDTLDREALSQFEVELAPTEEGFLVLVRGKDPGEDLRSVETTRLAPFLARNRWVRQNLTEFQRSALSFGDLVVDGRDMGTIVFPNAGLKVFLTASLEERSRRRLLQEGKPLDEKSIRQEALRISKRDETDTDRAVAPLKKPMDALEIDTTDLSFETQVVRIVAAASALTREATEK